jgi:hypothetical protein
MLYYGAATSMLIAVLASSLVSPIFWTLVILESYHFCTCINACRIYYLCSNNNGNRPRAAFLVSDIVAGCDNDSDIQVIEYHDKRDEITRKYDTSQKIILDLSKLVLAILSLIFSYCFFRVVQSN